MDEKKTVTIGGGLSIGTLCILTFIVFLILKLCGVITWSWLCVCIPLIVYAGLIGLALVIFVIFMIIVLIAAFIAS